MKKHLLFFGGLFGPLLYLLHDIVGGIITPNYNFFFNTISDLTKSDSSFVLGSILLATSALCGVFFGLGIFKFENKIAGSILVMLSIFNVFTATIFPQDPIGEPFTFPGIMHLVLVGLSALLIFPVVIIIGKKNKSIKKFSFGVITIMIIFGILSGIAIAKDINLLGLLERTSIYSLQIWYVAVSWFMIKKHR